MSVSDKINDGSYDVTTGPDSLTEGSCSSDSNLPDSESPAPDSLNDADNISRSSHSSDSGSGSGSSHAESFKSTHSSGYDSCNSSGVPAPPPPPPVAQSHSSSNCSSSSEKTSSSVSESVSQQSSKVQKQLDVPATVAQNKQQLARVSVSLDSSFGDETPPPLPMSPPPDFPISSPFPPFYVPPSGLPPPLFLHASNLSNATPLIRKLTKALSASTPHLDQDISDCSIASSFEDLTPAEFSSANPLSALSALSHSTPNLSPKMKKRRSSLSNCPFDAANSVIVEENEDRDYSSRTDLRTNNTFAESKNGETTLARGQSIRSNNTFAESNNGETTLARGQSIRKSKKKNSKDNFPHISVPVMHISSPTNVCLPPSVDLSNPIYIPIRRQASSSPMRSRSPSPNRMSFSDPYITEVIPNQNSCPFSRFLPQLPDFSSGRGERTRNFVRRSIKSPAMSTLRQSTRSLSSALTSLRKSSRCFKSTLLSSLNRASSMDELDVPESARATANNISSPCVPKPVHSFAYCSPSSIESATLKSVKSKNMFSLYKSAPKKDRYSIQSNSLFIPNHVSSSPNPSNDHTSPATLMSFKSFRDSSDSLADDSVDSGQLPELNYSASSLNSSFDSLSRSQSALVQRPDESLRDLYVFSDTEMKNITSSIGRSLTNQLSRPKIDLSPSENRATRSFNVQDDTILSSGRSSVSEDINDSKETSLARNVKKRFKAREQRKKLKLHSDRGEIDSPQTHARENLPQVEPGDHKEPQLHQSCAELYQTSATETKPGKILHRAASVSMLPSHLELPMKRKPLVGVPIDERQFQLQQQLLHCLKQRLNEYNTRGCVSPLPPPTVPAKPSKSSHRKKDDHSPKEEYEVEGQGECGVEKEHQALGQQRKYEEEQEVKREGEFEFKQKLKQELVQERELKLKQELEQEQELKRERELELRRKLKQELEEERKLELQQKFKKEQELEQERAMELKRKLKHELKQERELEMEQKLKQEREREQELKKEHELELNRKLKQELEQEQKLELQQKIKKEQQMVEQDLKRELELERKQKLEKEQELERKRKLRQEKLEMNRQAELEQLELKREKEAQRECEFERARELERQRELEVELELECKRKVLQEEKLKKERELQREKELRDKELERRLELELKNRMQEEQEAKLKEKLELERELQRQRELERERELEWQRELEWESELKKRREKEGLRELEKEREIKQQKENEKLRELKRIEDEEKKREMERLQEQTCQLFLKRQQEGRKKALELQETSDRDQQQKHHKELRMAIEEEQRKREKEQQRQLQQIWQRKQDKVKEQRRKIEQLLEIDRQREIEQENELELQKRRLEQQEMELNMQEVDLDIEPPYGFTSADSDDCVQPPALPQRLHGRQPSGKEPTQKVVNASTGTRTPSKIEEQKKSTMSSEQTKPVQQLKKMLMYHMEQHSLQQKRMLMKKRQDGVTEKSQRVRETSASGYKPPLTSRDNERNKGSSTCENGASGYKPPLTSRDNERNKESSTCENAASGYKLPLTSRDNERNKGSSTCENDDDADDDKVATNIDEFIEIKLQAEKEADGEPTSLMLLPPPANFCDFGHLSLQDKISSDETPGVETIRDDSEMMADDHAIQASSSTLRKKKSKNKRVTFGDNDTEINYYPEVSDDTERRTHPGFNALALKRPKGKHGVIAYSTPVMRPLLSAFETDSLSFGEKFTESIFDPSSLITPPPASCYSSSFSTESPPFSSSEGRLQCSDDEDSLEGDSSGARAETFA